MISENAEKVLRERYYLKDDAGKVIENWEQLAERVARTTAAVDETYGATVLQAAVTFDKFKQIVHDLDFLPNSPWLANAGARTGQGSACFVLAVPDSLAGIFETVKNAALIHQTGGGTGFAFSRLRPKNSHVHSTKGKASGPVSFMKVIDAATESIKQGGMRRGANMGILRIDHPDILEFIACKDDKTQLTNFNISVAVTDAFMAALEARTTYDLVFEGKRYASYDAEEVWNMIAHRAHATGEPGIVFMDRMNAYNPVSFIELYEATNPCGEQALIPNESCNLGSINLERFVTERRTYNGEFCGDTSSVVKTEIEWDRLRTVVRTATHFLDNVIDANAYVPLVPEIAEMAKRTRKIGLGVMGYARMLYKLGIPYGSEEAIKLAEQLMSFIDYWSKVESVELAKKRGAYPAFNENRDESLKFFGRVCQDRWEQQPEVTEGNAHPDCWYSGLFQDIVNYGIRNSNTTTVAPTGTLSIIADTSGGIEPVFALAFKRFQADQHMVDSDPVFRAHLESFGLSPARIESIMAQVDDNHGSLKDLDRNMVVPLESEALFVTAHDIPPEKHVLTQAAFQRFNDSSISKTINFPESASVEDVLTAYQLAWDTGCKGITVYRNNSRQFQPLSVKASTNETTEPAKPVESETAEVSGIFESEPGYPESRFGTDEARCPNCEAITPKLDGCIKCGNCGYYACTR